MDNECKDIKPQLCGGRLIPYVPSEETENEAQND